MKKIKKQILYFLTITTITCCLFLMNGCENSNPTSAITAPSTPTGLNASDGTSANIVSLQWTISEGVVTYYKIFRAPVEQGTTGDYILRKDFHYPDIQGSTASFEDDQISKSKIYSYRISAVNKGGASELSNSDTGYGDQLSPDLPSPPTNSLLTTNNQVHKIYIDFAPVADITKYYLYRSNSPMGEYIKIADISDTDAVELEVSAGVFHYFAYCDDSTDTNLWTEIVEGQAYYYRISSVNSSNIEGPKSDIINGWFPYQVPVTAPEDLAASDGTYSNKITVSWSAATGATSYLVYRSDPTGSDCPAPAASSTYSQISTVSGTSYDDSDISIGQNYCYSVRSANAAGQSNIYAIQDIGNADLLGTSSPGNPDGIMATTDGINEISITWTRADDIASHYLIYRSTDPLSGYSAVGTVADGSDESLTWKDGNGSNGSVATDTQYYYKVKAVLYEGEDPSNALISESSLTDHALGSALPSTPGISTVAASKNSHWNRIDVSWTAIDLAATYTLYRKIGSGPWERITKDMTSTEYIDNSSTIIAIWDTNITYRIYGVNSNPASNAGTATVPSATANFGEDYGTVELKAPSISTEDAKGVFTGNLTTTWQPIPADDTSGRISYLLYWKKKNDSSWNSPIYIDHSFFNNTDNQYIWSQDGFSVAGAEYNVKIIAVYTSDNHHGPESNITETACW